jgi:DNA polymerase-2
MASREVLVSFRIFFVFLVDLSIPPGIGWTPNHTRRADQAENPCRTRLPDGTRMCQRVPQNTGTVPQNAGIDPPDPSATNLTGWLLDFYPRRDRIILWFMLPDGQRLRLTDPFAPLFHIHTRQFDTGRQQQLRRFIDHTPGLQWLDIIHKRNFWTDRMVEVTAIRVCDLDHYDRNLRKLDRHFPDLTFFNCDISPEVHYAYEKNIFPTAFCRFTANLESNRLLQCEPLEDPYDIHYKLPPLRQAELTGGGILAGRYPRIRSLSLRMDGRTVTWDDAPPREILLSLRGYLQQEDPDVIWTEGGDASLVPSLLGFALQCNLETGLDRENGIRRQLVTEGRSYMSYGQVLYRSPDYPLFGRWHIDRRNSFWATETGLDGLVEVARVSKLPVQRAARRSIGTGISSIELDLAYRDGYLIPWKKTRPEDWKSASMLIRTDRGGLVYQPLVGAYDDVVELDFVSMYPSIMVNCNVSPETLNCACCPPEPDVPEIGYTLCRKRQGLVPRALKPIIEKRTSYKQQMKERHRAGNEELHACFKGRQGALKWLLVCCFGYLGYRNARFGRIEAHETTCAFSREKLLQAREICESRGYEVIHAIVDCVWIHKAGTRQEEIDDLCLEINETTGLNIAMEGHYRWIAFLPSSMDPDRPVPNRYFGCFRDGSLKYRGIEIRRGDRAPYVQQVQGELLEVLREAHSLEDCRSLRDRLVEIARQAETRLRNGEVSFEDLLLKRKTSRSAGEYRGNGMTAVAARQAAKAGIKLHPGQSVVFLVTGAGDPDPDSRIRIVPLIRHHDTYDTNYYITQVRKAADTILIPLLDISIEEIIAEEDRAAISVQEKQNTYNNTPSGGISQPDFLEPCNPAARTTS